MKENNYITNHPNYELREYFQILCNNDYPGFIDKYINCPELQRLKGIGLFCGVDYNQLPTHNVKYWYSRLDHSVACALIVWHLTKDKTQTLAALFHDVGTPAFSHCVDYMYNDYLNQESSEKTIDTMIKNSNIIKRYLIEDNINYEDIINIEKFPIVENKRPKICADRLESILSTGLVWARFWSIEDIRNIYNKITVLKNEENNDEIGFGNIKIGEYFYKGAFKYSVLLQLNEDKLSMKLTSDILKMLIDYQIITENDLYRLSEEEIIDRIKQSSNKTIKYLWTKFENLKRVEKSNVKPVDKYYISLDCKKRYVNPLIKTNNCNQRITNISELAKRLEKIYTNFNDTNYAYIDMEPIHVLKFKN